MDQDEEVPVKQKRILFGCRVEVEGEDPCEDILHLLDTCRTIEEMEKNNGGPFIAAVMRAMRDLTNKKLFAEILVVKPGKVYAKPREQYRGKSNEYSF